MRDRRGWIAVAIAAGAAWACSSDVATMVGDAMVDAGSALEDAGEELRDATTDAARAQVTAECTIEEGGVLYAEAAIDVDPATVHSATAILCDIEGTPPVGFGGLDCTGGVARFDATRARVQCGGGDPTTTGYRWRSVRIFIE